MILLTVKDGRPLPVQIPLRGFQNPSDAEVQTGLMQLAAAHSPDNPLRVSLPAGRHLQVATAANAEHTVIGCAPIGHYKALEAPFLAQNAVQKPLVLRGIYAVNPVVRAHERPRLRLLDNHFKSCQIDFTQCAFVYHRRNRHATILLIVRREMLDAGADAFALHAAHIACGELAREIRILRKIFKISPAQRRAFYIHTGAKQDGNVLRLALLA